MFFNRYSAKENELLLSDLEAAKGCLVAKNFISMEDLWPGFFKGQTRSAYALFLQTIKLAKEGSIEFNIVSTPKRTRNTKNKPVPSRRFTKGCLYEQVLVLIQKEIITATKKATTSILQMMEQIADENIALKEEIKRLRPFENIVRQKYKHELEFRGGM